MCIHRSTEVRVLFGEEPWQTCINFLHSDELWIVCFMLVHWDLYYSTNHQSCDLNSYNLLVLMHELLQYS